MLLKLVDVVHGSLYILGLFAQILEIFHLGGVVVLVVGGGRPKRALQQRELAGIDGNLLKGLVIILIDEVA